jgi:hypothetical protein
MSEHTLILFSVIGKETNAYYEFMDATDTLNLEVRQIIRTRSPGITIVQVGFQGDLINVLKEALKNHLWLVNSLLKVSKVSHIIPMQDGPELLKLSSTLNEWIDGHKYRITLRRVKNRDTRLQFIREITSNITAPVDLEEYEREIIVYLIDSKFYFVLGNNDEVSLEKLGDDDILDNSFN